MPIVSKGNYNKEKFKMNSSEVQILPLKEAAERFQAEDAEEIGHASERSA